MLLHILDVIEFFKIEALNNKLNPNEASIWRSLCRDYSKKFSTPLADVENLSHEKILLNLYEDELENADVSENLENWTKVLKRLSSPDDYEAEEKEEFDDFVEEARLEEAERLAKGKPIHSKIDQYQVPEDIDPFKKRVLDKEKTDSEIKPSGGSVNFSGLKDDES